jgi:hypothetical protein
MRLTSCFAVFGGGLIFLATPGGVVESANLSNRASISADRSTIGRRCHAMTENFSVFSFVGGPDAEKLGRRAEELRRQLRERWLDGTHHATWPVRCQVVVHGSRTSYSHSVGRGANSEPDSGGRSTTAQQEPRGLNPVGLRIASCTVVRNLSRIASTASRPTSRHPSRLERPSRSRTIGLESCAVPIL